MKKPFVIFSALLVSTLVACGAGTDPTPLGSTGDFEASLTPATASVTQGQQASLTIKLNRTNGFAGAVIVSVPNSSAGIAAATLTIPAESDTDVLSLSTDASATVGLHKLELNAVSGNLSHPISLELTVTDASTPDFSLAVTPLSVSVKQGLSKALDVTLNRLNGFAGAVSVTLGNPPAGLSAASVVIPAGSSTGKLNVVAGANAATGSGSTTVKGVSGALSHNANLSWTILSAVNPDFALNVIGGLSVIQGNADGVKVNLDRQNGFAGPVIVTLTNPSAGIAAAPLTIPAGSSSEFFEIGVGAQVPVGTVNITLSGTGGGLTRTLKQVLTVVAGPDKTAPTLVSSSPANNATGVSIGTGVILTFSEAMNPNLTFASFSPQGGGTNSHWLNGNTTLKLNLIATVPGQPSNVYKGNTAYTLSVDGEDEAGNAMSGTKTFKFTTENLSDTTAPTVLDTIPAAAAQGVAPGLGKTFSATFSEKMGSSVLNAVNFVPNAGATNCVFTDSSNTTVQCTPTDGLLGNQFYIMTITTAAKDEAGNPLAQLNAVSFNTGPKPDSTKPKMNSSQPSAATPVIDTNTSIAVYFSEAMDKVATQAAFTFISPALTASQSVSFAWNQNGNSLVIKRSPNFIHGETVTWKVGAGAKDVSGNTLEAASTGTHSFKIYTLGSFKLYSDGSLDGQANSKGVAQPHGDDLRTQAYSTFYTRGFISFDLQQLPSTATLNTIKSATLNVYQQAVGCGGKYALLGNVLAENISYALLSPLLFSTFFDTAPVSSGTTNVLATKSKVGYKTMDASQQVLFDVSHSNSLYNRSQWRLRFGQESNGTSQNCGDIVWAGGTGVQAERPYLNITYLHP